MQLPRPKWVTGRQMESITISTAAILAGIMWPGAAISFLGAESKSHSWGNDNVTKTATCKEASLKKQTCAVCGTARTTEIAKLTTHTFGPWESVDEKTHQRICSVCSKRESKDHTAGENWLSNAELH